MKKIIDYLDDIKRNLGSDYKAANKLEINRAALCMIRKRGQMSDETAIKMAEILEIDASETLIAAAIARSEGKTKEAWEKISKMAGIAASLGWILINSEVFIFAINNIHYANNMEAGYWGPG